MPNDKVHIGVNVPREIYDALIQEGVKIAPLIVNLLKQRHDMIVHTKQPITVAPLEPVRKSSLKELVINTVLELDINIDEARANGGFSHSQVSEVYDRLKTRGIATTREAVYNILTEKWMKI